MRDRVPRHGNEGSLEIIFNLERLDQTGIGPFSNPVVRPEEYIGAFTALGGCLKFVGDLLLCFNLDRGTNIFFKSFAKVAQGVVSPVITYPDQEFTIRPGKCLSGTKDKENSTKELFHHSVNARGVKSNAGYRCRQSPKKGYSFLGLVCHRPAY